MFLKVKNKIKMCTDVTVAQQTCICSIKKLQKALKYSIQGQILNKYSEF